LLAYANGWYRSERDPEQIAQLAQQVVQRGYQAMKIDPFGAGHEQLSAHERQISLAIIRQVRQAVGDDIELYVEGHGRFDLPTAMDLANEMEPYRPGFFEEPLIPELNDQLPELIRQTNVTMALGERLSTPKLFEWVTADCDQLVLQPDISHIGGICGLREVIYLADQRGWRVAPHNAGGPLATTHAVHLGLTEPAIMIQETFDDFEQTWVRQAFPGRAEVVDGQYALSEQPGFGVNVQEDLLNEHPFTDLHLDLYAQGWERRADEARS